MILETIVLTHLALINPSDPTQSSFYRAGTSDCDSSAWWWGPEATKLPILSLPYEVYDKDMNLVPTGHYKASISKDKKYILLFENKNIKGVFPITIYTENLPKIQINEIRIQHIRREYLLLEIFQDDKKAVGIALLKPLKEYKDSEEMKIYEQEEYMKKEKRNNQQ